MMVNPDVDGYTQTLNHRKILRKTQKNNLLKTKIILKPKYKVGGGPVFTPSLPGAIRLSSPSVTPLLMSTENSTFICNNDFTNSPEDSLPQLHCQKL